MLNFDKTEVLNQITFDNIFELIESFGGNPEITSFGLISDTICHNPPGEGSRKLYYYRNEDDGKAWFRCYTACAEVFDVFQLVIKVAEIQWNKQYDLNNAVRWVAMRFGISGEVIQDNSEELIADWQFLADYTRIQNIELSTIQQITLKEYDNKILNNFNYDVKISPWLNENITQEILDYTGIGYYPGSDQIIIPHYDKDGRLIGIRGRTVCAAEAEIYGKYRPLRVNKQTYSHPLGYNLYGLNWGATIGTIKKAIVFEAEKSVLKYMSYFGAENNIAVACCGSSLSANQIQLLKNAGAQEIIIAFDRDFVEIGDDVFKHLKANLIKLHNKYKNDILISFMFDKHLITELKSSPIDNGKEKFLQLFKERIIL